MLICQYNFKIIFIKLEIIEITIYIYQKIQTIINTIRNSYSHLQYIRGFAIVSAHKCMIH